jgi:hypothetical protein
MEVKVQSLVARSKVAVVELHMDLDTARAWLPLVDSSVEVALGGVRLSPGQHEGGRAAKAVRRSKARQVFDLAKDAAEQKKRRRKKEAERPPPSRKHVDTTRDKLRAQMPDGWLLVSDFAAEVCRAIPTVRGWIHRGKIRPKDIQQVSVNNYKQSQVMAIRASLVPQKRSGQPGKGGSLAPIMALVDRVGASGAAKRLGLQEAAVRAAYEQARVKGMVVKFGVGGAADRLDLAPDEVLQVDEGPDLLWGEYAASVVAELASVMKLEEDRGDAREDDDEREDTAKSVPASEEETMGAGEAAWGERR